MSAHQGLQSVVATADHSCYRDFSSQTRIQNQSISHQEPVVTQVKTTESVVSMGINPRIEQNKLWLEFIQHIGELITDGGEIVPIFGSIGQRNINITVHFPKGKVARGMYRKSRDTFIRLKTGGGSITSAIGANTSNIDTLKSYVVSSTDKVELKEDTNNKIEVDGTSAAEKVTITVAGTEALEIDDATASFNGLIKSTGIELINLSDSLIMKDSAGDRWRIQIQTDGTLRTTKL